MEVRTSPFWRRPSVWSGPVPSTVSTMRVAIPVSMSAATTAVFWELVIWAWLVSSTSCWDRDGGQT